MKILEGRVVQAEGVASARAGGERGGAVLLGTVSGQEVERRGCRGRRAEQRGACGPL